MRETTDIFIGVPRSKNTHIKVEINSVDVTARVKESLWIYPCTIGIGTFKMILSNAHGQLTGDYNKGDTVKFYADNSDGTTLQFWGRVDYIKDSISEGGQFLEIEGRHRAFLLNEYLVCHSATSTSTSAILKEIIDKLPTNYGFTYDDVSTTTDSMDVEWSYKPFWDCVVELCHFAGYDCYVDNDLDFHFFEANSILNTEDAIVERDNFLSSKEWGTDDYNEKTRVVVMGQDDDGLPIVYTAISATETTIREVFIKDTSANTEQKVQDLADSKLSELTNRNPQAVMESLGLETVKPGENIWIVVPRQKVAGQYKIIQLTHKFGQKYGGWRTSSLIEEEVDELSQTIRKINQKGNLATQSENVNKLNYSFNFTFDDDVKTDSHDTTQVLNSKLMLSSDSATDGTWLSTTKTADTNLTKVELRVKGKDIWGSEFYFSVDNGVTWQQIDVDDFSTLITPNLSYNVIKIKVKLIRPTGWESLNPEVNSLVLLYS